MKKIVTFVLLVLIFSMTACTPAATAAPTLPPATQPAAATTPTQPEPSAEPTAVTAPTEAQPSSGLKQYSNSAFGLSFAYPAGWFGPDEYISEPTLRVAIGSDVVYPYGTGLEEQVYTLKNSYAMVIQYTKNNQNDFFQETYQKLSGLQEGQSLSDARSMITLVRRLNLGRFEGFEYISTLSETAQTEAVYSREVILVDDQSNLLTVMGTPNNVEVASGQQWRDVYRAVDQANVEIFHQIIDSLLIE
jgi:hypothetical protein